MITSQVLSWVYNLGSNIPVGTNVAKEDIRPDPRIENLRSSPFPEFHIIMIILIRFPIPAPFFLPFEDRKCFEQERWIL